MRNVILFLYFTFLSFILLGQTNLETEFKAIESRGISLEKNIKNLDKQIFGDENYCKEVKLLLQQTIILNSDVNNFFSKADENKDYSWNIRKPMIRETEIWRDYLSGLNSTCVNKDTKKNLSSEHKNPTNSIPEKSYGQKFSAISGMASDALGNFSNNMLNNALEEFNSSSGPVNYKKNEKVNLWSDNKQIDDLLSNDLFDDNINLENIVSSDQSNSRSIYEPLSIDSLNNKILFDRRSEYLNSKSEYHPLNVDCYINEGIIDQLQWRSSSVFGPKMGWDNLATYIEKNGELLHSAFSNGLELKFLLIKAQDDAGITKIVCHVDKYDSKSHMYIDSTNHGKTVHYYRVLLMVKNNTNKIIDFGGCDIASVNFKGIKSSNFMRCHKELCSSTVQSEWNFNSVLGLGCVLNCSSQNKFNKSIVGTLLPDDYIISWASDFFPNEPVFDSYSISKYRILD